MLCGKPLFPGKDDVEQIKRILEVLGKPSPQEAPSLAALPGYVSGWGGMYVGGGVGKGGVCVGVWGYVGGGICVYGG